jgi:hypothetical protein
MSQETFERELARHADGVHGAPLSFDDVRSKAVSIRRRRRATVTGGIAAAVALAVIVPSVLTGGQDKGSRAPEPAPSPPGHTAVLHDQMLTRPDGSEVALDVDNQDVSQLGLLTDGRIVVASQDPYGILVFGPDGALQRHYPALVNAITMSSTDDAVAWIGGDSESDRGVRVLSSGTAEPVVLPGIPAAGEFTGAVNAVLGPDRVLANGGYGTDTVVTPEGTEELRTSEPLTVTDVSPDGNLWAVQYADDADPQFGCSGLYDPEAAEMVARSCDTSGLQFSPDGEHLLGMRGDNNMAGSADVFDLDLEPVVSYSPDPAVVSRAAWADADHLLVATADWHDNMWSLVRVGLDGGDPTVLDGPGDGRNPEMVAEYLLSE